MTKRKDPAYLLKRGRPTKYTPKIGRAIAHDWTMGETRDQISDKYAIPYDTLLNWERTFPDFQQAMDRAREQKAHRFADQVIEIADDKTQDYVEFETKAGSKRREPNHELVQRSRLRTDVRLKLMAMWAPKIYGQASRLELTGAGGGPILLEQITLVAMRELEAERGHTISGGAQPRLVDATNNQDESTPTSKP
jgi:hypothetical protein